MKYTAKDIAYIGIFSTLVFAATLINVVIPFAPNGGLVHFGTTVGVIALLVAGPRIGILAGTIGMTMFDILGGWAIWAPATLIARYGLGYLMAKFSFGHERAGNNLSYNLIGLVIGGLWMIFIYYVYEALLYHNLITPIASISANVLQLVLAAIIGLPLSIALKKIIK